VTLLETCLQGRLIDLLVLGWICATLCVDIVGQHVLSVVNATLSRLGVRPPISVERRLSIISSEGRISDPTRRVVELALLFIEFALLL